MCMKIALLGITTIIIRLGRCHCESGMRSNKEKINICNVRTSAQNQEQLYEKKNAIILPYENRIQPLSFINMHLQREYSQIHCFEYNWCRNWHGKRCKNKRMIMTKINVLFGSFFSPSSSSCTSSNTKEKIGVASKTLCRSGKTKANENEIYEYHIAVR